MMDSVLALVKRHLRIGPGDIVTHESIVLTPEELRDVLPEPRHRHLTGTDMILTTLEVEKGGQRFWVHVLTDPRTRSHKGIAVQSSDYEILQVIHL